MISGCLWLRCLRHEAGHQAVGDGGANPYFYEQIVGVLVDGFQIDVHIVERGYEYVDDADGPQVALGVALPVLAGIEERKHAEQQHREREARQVEREIGQWRREEDVAQQHRHAHRHGAPVVKLLSGEAPRVEEIHPYHRQAGDVEQVEHQFGPHLGQTEVEDGIEHHPDGERTADGSDDDVENLGSFLESCFHLILINDLYLFRYSS